jgi:hypothetical protein
MGYSIATGVSACPDAGGWLVLPGDMPMVRTGTLLEVARELANHAVVFAQHKDARASGGLFRRATRNSPAFAATRRAPLVARYPAIGIEVDDPGVLIDVDTEADLDAVRRAQQHGKRRRSGCDSAQREGELLEPLDLAVADAAAAQRRGGLQQVVERAAVASGGMAQDVELFVAQCAGVAGLARSSVKARARTAPCGVRQGSQRGSYTPVGISRAHRRSSSSGARWRSMR